MRAHRGFTLTELFIVISIIMILTTVAVSVNSGVVDTFKFNNAFNKMVLMVQRARSQAATGKNKTSVAAYSVLFNKNPLKFTVSECTDASCGGASPVETYTVPNSSGISLELKNLATGGDCADNSSVIFENGTAQANLLCNGAGTGNLKLTLTLAAGRDNEKKRCFLLHGASGIPQVEAGAACP